VSIGGIERDSEGKTPSSKARDVEVTITLEDKGKDQCFSLESWNNSLTKAEWEPLKPVATTQLA